LETHFHDCPLYNVIYLFFSHAAWKSQMSRVIQGLSNCESAQQCVFLCYISLINDTALEEKYVYFLQIFIWEN
jgi:hypothetical protein